MTEDMGLSFWRLILKGWSPSRSVGIGDSKDLFVKRVDHAKKIVLVIHHYGGQPRDLEAVATVIRHAHSDADIVIPQLPLHYGSFHDPDMIVEKLLGLLDDEDGKRNYQEIILVGYSLGSLLARKLYVRACGENERAPFGRKFGKQPCRSWAIKISRIVLLAGLNRGWSISHHLQIKTIIVWCAGIAVLKFVGKFKGRPLIFAVRRGSSFVVQLRLQWLEMRAAARNNIEFAHIKDVGIGNALTIQLLGSVDDLVSPEDNVDAVSGRDFVYLDVPHSGHINVIFMEPELSQSDDGKKWAQERAKLFRAALTAPADNLRAMSLQPVDEPYDVAAERIDRVVFVLHGIRDLGYWTHKVARRVRKLGKNSEPPVNYATETSTYGYFAMLPFLSKSVRRQKVNWLMDQYVEDRARYPTATFSFIGHSNGTWLLYDALNEYSACRFDHVVFAGSVVPTTANWEPFLSNGQLGALCNFVATTDWVVALFPRALEKIRWFELGAAGHDGFVQGGPISGVPHSHSSTIINRGFIIGQHSAAIKEEMWDILADFIVTGECPPLSKSMLSAKPNVFLWWIGRAAPLPLMIIVVSVILIAVWLLGGDIVFGIRSPVEWMKVFLGLLWVLLVWQFVTRF